MQETLIWFLGLKVPLEKGEATQSSILGLSWWLRQWRLPLQCRSLGFDPWVGKISWGGHGNPLQYSFLENPHGQRNLVDCSPWGHRVGHDWVTKPTQHLWLTGLISFWLKDSQESSPALQFESINSSLLSLPYGPTLTSVHDYWKKP